jgi:hypothetical protein
MDLKTFVAESLKQIAEGIKDAQDADTGAWIAPGVIFDKGALRAHDNSSETVAQFVSFDVAVMATESDSMKGGIAIKVLELVSAGTKAASETQNSSVSRIKFEIPIVWPRGGKSKWRQ